MKMLTEQRLRELLERAYKAGFEEGPKWKDARSSAPTIYASFNEPEMRNVIDELIHICDRDEPGSPDSADAFAYMVQKPVFHLRSYGDVSASQLQEYVNKSGVSAAEKVIVAGILDGSRELVDLYPGTQAIRAWIERHKARHGGASPSDDEVLEAAHTDPPFSIDV